MATFEIKLIDLGVKHAMARIKHPRTNGKLEWFHLEPHLTSFDESASSTVRNVKLGDHVGDRFMLLEWWIR